MKKTTILKTVYAVLILLLSFTSVAQTYKTFSLRKKVDLRGKMLVIGNNILSKDKTAAFGNNNGDDKVSNQDVYMQYVDIDGDASTFNSSSADLVAPTQKDGSASTCYRVAYAALYWGAVLQNGSRTDIDKVKLKLPGASTYTPIDGEIIYDDENNPIVSFKNEPGNTPYACYADVTSLLANLPSLTGTYTVADLVSNEGTNGSTGMCAGWTLFVIYEDPTLTMKSFNLFDGFAALFNGRTEVIPVSGFRTPLSGPIDLQFAYAALDGEKPKNQSKLEFETKEVTTQLRPQNSFFNSTIENADGVSTPRNPFSTNTLGYDTGMLEVKKANPEFIVHDQTSTNFTLQVAQGQADPVFAFLGSYAVDIIAPKIDLTKIVKNDSGTNIGGGTVGLGQALTYEIRYESVGNDHVKNFTIKDVLPVNVTLANWVLPPGVSVDPVVRFDALGNQISGYNSATRTIIFNVADSYAEINDAGIIRINVQVATDCRNLTTACSNEIKNQAFATYQGVINTNVFKEEGSFASTACKLGSPDSTNFLVDITNCPFIQNVILCGSSVVLKAADGYTNYSWSKNQDGSSPIGSGQTFTATQTGTYYVHSTAPATCKSIVETIIVKNFGTTNTNPVIPYAQAPYKGEVVTCPNDGKLLPNLFLCGAGDFRDIKTGISGTQSIVWQKLDEVNCPSTAIANCADENLANSCWKDMGTGPDYRANTAGKFRVVLTYPNGCFSIFYFNVYQNLLDPTFTKKDIVCGSLGEIVIGNVPSGYEYSLDGTNYQLSPKFTITAAGNYTVYIKQQNVNTNPCIFTVPNIQIYSRDLNVRTFVTQPSCHGISDGSIKLIADNVDPQYFFSVVKDGIPFNSIGSTPVNEYTIDKLSPGVYTVNVSTQPAGCIYRNTIIIIDPPLLTVTATSKPITCVDGEITINAQGGTANYNYYVNGTNVILNTPSTTFTVPVATPGDYVVKVVDLNNCEASTTVKVTAIPKPDYNITKTDIVCYGSNTGAIQFNVTNANGYTLAYSIDNGVTYSPNPIFSNLVAGTYAVILRYSLGGVNCFITPQTITITEPMALIASAGVSELAGCGPNGEGKVRITNPQGGTPFPAPYPYRYSFDNQTTWVTSNEAYKAPGTYTVYIKDVNGCIFAMPNIIIDPKPVPPTIVVDNPVYNCDGTANTTATITNQGGANYQYGYLLDGAVNTNSPPNVFVNIPSGSHTVSVTYNLVSVPTYSNLLKEDFGSGAPTTAPGIASAYCFNDQHINPPYSCPNPTRSVEDNQYSVASDFWRSDDPNGTNAGAWYHYKDHTTNGTDPKGRFLLVNIGSAAGNYGVLYSKPIVDVIRNQPIIVDVYLANLLRTSTPANKADPDFIIELVDGLGNVIDSKATGIIPRNEVWNLKTLSLNPGNNTSLTFKIRSGSILYNGNDAVIDDILVYQLPKSCITQVDFPFIVPSGEAFTASVIGHKDVKCAGDSNGEITIAAQNFNTTAGFQYSINSGTTWIPVMTSPHTITGLAAGNYTVQIRYDNTGTCSFSFPQTISAPTPLTLTASVTTQAICGTGATITAVAGGGTPAYQYALRDAAGTGVVRPYQTSPQFTNVAPGSYTVFVQDANSCSNAIGAAVNVVAPVGPTATLGATTDYCYTTADPATLVVNVTGGTAPFTYALDGNAAVSSSLTTFSFTNVAPGTHTIVVTDSKNCTDTISNITIAAPLQLTANLTQDLTCLVDASINFNVTGGNGTPYNYTVSHNGGAATTVTSFPYTTALDGNYVFTVTDSKGCQATSNTVVVSPKTTPTLTYTKTDITCNNANDGTITVTASNGFTSAYTYVITPNAGTLVGNQFTGLAAGTYAIKVVDSKGCESTPSNVNIVNPTEVGGTISATDIKCSAIGTVPAVVTVNGTGGTAPYQYSFNVTSSFSNANTFSTTVAGTVTAYIRDANGCQTSRSITIGGLDPITDITIVDNGYDCSTTPAGGQVTLTAVKAGTANPMSYQIISGPLGYNATANTTGIFQGLAGGSYIFQVTDTETNCSFTKSYTISGTPAITTGGSVTTTIKCFGGNGNIQFTVSGVSTSGYDYVIKDAGNTTVDSNTNQTAATISLSNVPASNYTITVTDRKTQCKSSYAVTLGQPSATVSITSATATNVNCNNYNSQITVSAIGGTPNYSYAVVKAGNPAPAAAAYGTSATLTVNTNSGVDLLWDVYVKDVNGCTPTTPTRVTIINDGSPAVTASVNQCTATGNTFTITATPSGTSLAPLTYSINGTSFQSSNVFTVAPGTYTVTIKDKNGCTATTSVTVYPKLTLIANPNITCSGSSSMSVDVALTANYGNSTSYTFHVSADGGTNWSVATNPYNTTAAGTYVFRVTDANGCFATATTTIVAPTKPEIAVAVDQNPNCNGEATGVLDVTIDPTKGQAPFVLNVHNDTYNIPYGTQTSGLRGGDYTITVTDAKGCIDTKNITITEPAALNFTLDSTPITCASDDLGTIKVIVPITGLGGTPPYTYTLTNNAGYAPITLPNATGTDYTFTDLNFGTYYVTVTDVNGCSLKKSEQVASPPNDLQIDVNSIASTCAGATVKVTAIGPDLTGGPYYFAIYQQDAGGLYPPTPPVFSPGVQPPYRAADFSDPSSATFTGLIPGVIYSFMVYDDTSKCTFIKQADSPTVVPTTLTTLRVVTDVTCKGSADGTVSITLDQTGSGTMPNTVDYEVYDSKTNLAITPGNNGTGIVVTSQPFTMPLIVGLAPGSYYVVITEHGGSFDGCKSATLPFDIYESLNDLELTATVTKNANCHPNVGQIVAVAKGGTTETREDPLANPPQVAMSIPYQYQILLSGDTPPLATSPGWGTTNTFSNLAPNNYVVYAMDANKCIKAFAIPLESDDAPTINTPAPICYDGNPFTITITGTVDPDIVGGATYSIDGSPFQSSSDFTFNEAKSYNLVIKDGNGCTATRDYIVNPQVLLRADLTQDLTCAANASITLTPTGGTGVYSAFEVSTDGGNNFVPVTTNPYPATVDGNYVFRVSDDQVPSCPAISNAVTVTPKTTPSATFDKTDITCIGDSDGTLTITPANGISPYTYTLTGAGANTSGDTTGYYSGLAAGTYTFVVTDAKNCPFTDTVTIDNKTAVTALPVVTPFGCSATNAPQDAVVTITPGGGTPGTTPTGYTYSFDGGNTFQESPSFTVNSVQTINYVVHDANGCSVNGSVDVLPYTRPTDMDLIASPIYCSTLGTVATVTVNTVTGGEAPYTYEIISPVAIAPNGTNSFANLAPNIYVVKVTDANGCSTTKAIEVKEASKISVTKQLVNDVFCKGGATGVVNFSVSNYITAGNYTFNLAPGAFIPTQVGDVISYTGLPAGTYTFTVTDGVSNCIATTTITVSEPTAALDFTTSATNINCNNDNATITVTATGGTASYKYAAVIAGGSAPVPTAFGISNQITVDTNTGANITWDVYVMDANDCLLSKTQTIILDANPAITNAVATPCPSPTGTYDITVTATGFSTALLYSIDGVSFQSGNIITVNAPGAYNVTVRDANGCVSTPTAVNILQPLTLQTNIVTLPSCDNNDGNVTASANGGSGNYQYKIDSGTYGPVTSFLGLASGSHTLYVQDTTTLCEVSVTIDLQAATPITNFGATSTSVTCNGGSDGTITATMATPAVGVNDNPVYMYTLSGAAIRPAQASPLFTGLAAGNYTVDVVSGRGCTAQAVVSIGEPNPIVVPPPTVTPFGCTSGNAMNFATITVNTPTGGSGTYTIYEFIKNGNPVPVQKGSSNVYTEADLAGGNYTINVYDSKGCSGTASAVINPFVQIDFGTPAITVNNPITCTNNEDITVNVVTTGTPTPTLDYLIQDILPGVPGVPGTFNQRNATGVFINLAVGNYMITVTNPVTGCSIKTVHYVNNPNTFDLTINNVVDVTCFDDTDGSVNITLVDRNVNDGNQAGLFTYTLQDALGNSLSGGSSTPAGTLVLNNLAGGTYTIAATLSGTPYCTVTKNFTITRPTAALAITETHTQITCVAGNNDGTISATATGGWPGGYEFELVGPVSVAYSTQTNFTGLTQGTYTLNVRDSKGCVATTTVILNNPTPITAAITPDKTLLTCFGDKDATITVSAPTGGSGNYLYTLVATYPSGLVIKNGPQQSNVFSGLGAASYQVEVSDNWSCSNLSINTITIAEPTEVIPSLVKATSQTCTTQATLTLSATGGTGPYTYSADGTFVVTGSPVTSGSFVSSTSPISVPVGTYHYYVRDANGCITHLSNDIKIDPLVPLTINLDKKEDIKCDNDGVIVVTAQGGLGNYSYTLTNLTTGVVSLPQPTGSFTGLAAGDYNVHVDSGDCTKDMPITIIPLANPPLLVADAIPTPVKCNGAGDGMITITVSGGTGIIKYAISPQLNQFFDGNNIDNQGNIINGHTFKNLKPGTYEVITQDQNGCFRYETGIVITEPTPVVAQINIMQEEACYGDKNGAFTISITGGTAPYKVSLDKPVDLVNPNYILPELASGQVHLFDNLLGGDHRVYIVDANGCEYPQDVIMQKSINVDPIARVDYACVNNAPGNTVTVLVGDDITNPADVWFALDGVPPYQQGNVFTDVAAGTHFVRAQHINPITTNVCEKDTPLFTIDTFLPLTLTLADGGLNEIVATATGGAGGYRYTFNGEDNGDNNKYIIYKSGDYTVTVTDANGCTATASRHFEYIDVCIPNYFSPNGDGVTDGWAPGCTENYKDLVVRIFDRYGRAVAILHVGDKWDGKYNGLELPTGDYWYILKLNDVKDAREFVGHFTLYR